GPACGAGDTGADADADAGADAGSSYSGGSIGGRAAPPPQAPLRRQSPSRVSGPTVAPAPPRRVRQTRVVSASCMRRGHSLLFCAPRVPCAPTTTVAAPLLAPHKYLITSHTLSRANLCPVRGPLSSNREVGLRWQGTGSGGPTERTRKP